MKPPDLIEVPIKPVVICWFVITKLEIDLNHINYGLDSITRSYNPYKRSDYSTDDVLQFFYLLHQANIEPCAFVNHYHYFSEIIDIDTKSYSISFCVNENHPSSAGIITFYRVNPK